MTLDTVGIRAAFADAGLRAGDLLMLHGDALALTQVALPSVAGRAEALFQSIEAVAGTGGTVILPAFSYSATKGEAFDPAVTPGAVGMLAEMFRSWPGVVRTMHPIFSVSAKGWLVPRILAASVEDSFGPGTVFDLLHETNALIACLACGFDRITFVHYVEQCAQVDYRFFKQFDAEVIEDGRGRRFPVRYLVRDLARETQTDLARLKARLQSEGLLRMVPFGRAALMAVRARDFYETAMALLAERPNALIREGA